MCFYLFIINYWIISWSIPQVILTGDLTEGRVTKIFRSVDFGNSFVTSELPFHPLMQITYNPRDSNILMVYSINVRPLIRHFLSVLCKRTCTNAVFFLIQYDLWLSEDFGGSWRKIHETVCLVKWYDCKQAVHKWISNNSPF